MLNVLGRCLLATIPGRLLVAVLVLLMLLLTPGDLAALLGEQGRRC